MSLDIFGAFTGLFVVVKDGQHALRFTLGRARSVVGPGIHFKIPIIQTFQVKETKHTTLDLEPQIIQLSDNLVYEIDSKVVYQIVNLRKAVIEVDDLVTGLQNRVVIAIQQVVSSKDRKTVTAVDQMCDEIRDELRNVEDQWGVRILQFGFSNISPSPTTLEITQLEMLAHEKLALYEHLADQGLSEEAAVALISGAVVSVHPDEPATSARRRRAQDDAYTDRAEGEMYGVLDEEKRRQKEKDAMENPGQPLDDESEGDEDL
tara:strand:+ start:1909 stop:2694 length:786 start_codon:yes stop_codon:yes gene_type:complete